MDYESVYTIDLSGYGRPGETMTVTAPSFSRKVRTRNLLLKGARVNGRNGKPTLEDLDNLADMEIISMLAYIGEAPFQPTVPSFLEFMDSLDAVRKGNADRLYDEISKYVKRINTGDDGPFAGSQQAGTESSE